MEQRSQPDGPFILAMFTHTLLAAMTYLFGKIATQHFPVLVLGLVRLTIGGMSFWMIAQLKNYDLKGIFKEAPKSFLFAGFLGVLVNQLCFLWGLKLTLPSHAALLYALTPAVVLVMSWLRGLEKLTGPKIFGITLAFSGVLALLSGRHGGVLPPHWMWGDLLVLMAVLAWAGYTVLSRPLVLRFGAKPATALSTLLGSSMFLPLGLVGLGGFDPSRIPAAAWLSALYLGVFASVVMYLLWFYALSLKEPSRVAIASNAQPILTALLAWSFLGQAVSRQFLLGTVLVISGVLLTQKRTAASPS